jgi:hypothetical protein
MKNFTKFYKYLLMFALFHQTTQSIDNIKQQIDTWTESYQNNSLTLLEEKLKTLLWYGTIENILPVKLNLDQTGFTDYYDIDETKYQDLINNWNKSDFVTAIILGNLEKNGLQSSLINYDNFHDVAQTGIYQWVLDHPADDTLYKAIITEFETGLKDEDNLINNNWLEEIADYFNL